MAYFEVFDSERKRFRFSLLVIGDATHQFLTGAPIDVPRQSSEIFDGRMRNRFITSIECLHLLSRFGESRVSCWLDGLRNQLQSNELRVIYCRRTAFN
jgi:hypothetical protein